MSAMFGEYALAGAMLTAIALVAFICIQRGSENLLRLARWGTVLLAGFLSVSVWALLEALLTDNFAVEYVRANSDSSLSVWYKIAAFWAGQEGGLLLWAWLLAMIGVVLAWQLRKEETRQTVITLGVMAGVTGFFACVMLLAKGANPFELAKPGAEAAGLRPVLQNWMMVWHPPMLFLGYAAFTSPFALWLGAMWGSGSKKQEARSQNEGTTAWLGEARGWMVFAWAALTVGIVLGSQWAYMVLGWGGYWGWDPVENASLLPWLTGTALLHASLMQSRRGMFKRWTASLTAASFFLCIFGTYLTRSGVVKSVHTFGDSPIGTFFLVFLCAVALVSAATILGRLNVLRAEHPVEDMISREGMILGANVLLSVMTVVVMVGTMWEKISGMVSGTPQTLGPPFYNHVVLPMALLVAGMMATGPVLGFSAGAFGRAWKKLLGMAAAGAVAAAVVGTMGYLNPWALLVAFAVTAVVAGVAIDVATALRSGVRSFAARPRHWGAQLAHLGLAAIVAGVAGSSLYAVKREKADALILTTAGPTQSAQVDRYTLTLKGIDVARRPTHAALVATIGVKDARGGTFELKPEERFYERGADGQAMPEVAISFGVFSDLYLNTVDIDAQQGIATLEVFVNPLVNWIWVGGALLTLGGLICLVPVREAKKGGQGAKDPQSRDAVALTVPLNVQGNGTVNGRKNGRSRQQTLTGRR